MQRNTALMRENKDITVNKEKEPENTKKGHRYNLYNLNF
jgi:hypothetical protein